MHFDEYYDFSNLPLSTRKFITEALTDLKNEEDEDSDNSKIVTEIHTGIVSIEQAINMYVNKYARTQKVRDLVDAFNGKLEEMATITSLQNDIANDKEKAKELAIQIEKIRDNIKSAKDAKTLTTEIDSIDLTTEVQTEVSEYLENVKNRISDMMSGENRVLKTKAMALCRELEKQCRALNAQIKVEIEKILDKSYQTTLAKIINEYKKHLTALNIGMNTSALGFNPVNLVSASLSNLNQIIDDNTETVDEGEYRTATRSKEGSFFRKAASFLTFGWVEDHTTETYQKWVSKNVDYVDMADVTNDYLEPIQRNLKSTQKNAIEHVQKETARLKDHLQKELAKIDKVLDEKLNALSQTEADSKAKAAEIAENEAKLEWLKQIQERVKNITEF